MIQPTGLFCRTSFHQLQSGEHQTCKSCSCSRRGKCYGRMYMTSELLRSSFIRLQQFCKEQKLEICGEKASFGGTCLTQLHIDEFWRVHDEVHIHYHECSLTLHVIMLTFLLQGIDSHLGQFTRILPSPDYIKFFSQEALSTNQLVAQWIHMYSKI